MNFDSSQQITYWDSNNYILLCALLKYQLIFSKDLNEPLGESDRRVKISASISRKGT